MEFLIILPIILVLYFISVYNSFVKTKTQIKASIQEIGNQLKRQASLIPNLQESTKSYLKHEKGVYEMITGARKSVTQAQDTQSLKDLDKAVADINKMIPQITVLMESNPELKANTTIMKFMEELEDTADKLSYARRSLIDLSQSYNQRLLTFPSNLVAQMFGFKEEKGLEVAESGEHTKVSDEETKDVKVKLE